MSKSIGSALMFDSDEVKATRAVGLPRLLRVAFFGSGITNDEYIQRWDHYVNIPPSTPDDKTPDAMKARSIRRHLMDRNKLTFNMLHYVLRAMGMDIVEISIRVTDRMTGQESVFSTSDTVEKLQEKISEENQVGITSL